MQVTPAAAATSAPAVGAGVFRPSSPWAALGQLRNLDMDAPLAGPVALAAGGALGLAVSVVANAITPLPAMVLGAFLGEASWLMSRADHHEHVQRVRLLQAYPALRQHALDSGVRFDDCARVRRLHDKVMANVQSVVEQYRGRCEAWGMPYSSVLENVLKAFYLNHCDLHPMCVITSRRENKRYLTAIPASALPAIDRAINTEGRSPCEVLGGMNFYFVALDLIGNTLRDAAAFRVTCSAGEWKVTAATMPDPAPLVDCYLPSNEPTVRVQRIARTSKQERARTGVTGLPDRRATPASTGVHEVRCSRQLDDQLRPLPKDSVTRRCVLQLMDDLAQGRSMGHHVSLGGEALLATDVQIEGLRGRNCWRILYRREGQAFNLLGIVDYHDRPSGRIKWW